MFIHADFLSQIKKRHLFRHLCLFLCFLVPLLSLSGCSSSRTIVNGLDEKEANEIIVFLANRGIDARKIQAAESGAGADKGVRWNISVASDKATRAMSLLNQSGLPRRRGQNLLGIFANVGLVPSDLQDKIRFQQGLAEQIASTIRKIDGVLDADVQLSFPEEDPLNPGATKGQITSSVYVKHSGVLDDPNAHLVTRIKRLVSGSINGLEYDSVTVIGDRARYTESDIFPSQLGEEQKEYVQLWSLVIAKESVRWFRTIFFSFILSIIVLFALLLWMGWKLYPFLDQPGGWKALFSLTPFVEKPVKKKKKTEEGEEEEEETEEKEEEKPQEKEPEEKPPEEE